MKSDGDRLIEHDEHFQEGFDENSVNLSCVLSWRVTDSGDLQVNFQNGWHFNSATGSNKPEFVDAILRRLRRR